MINNVGKAALGYVGTIGLAGTAMNVAESNADEQYNPRIESLGLSLAVGGTSAAIGYGAYKASDSLIKNNFTNAKKLGQGIADYGLAPLGKFGIGFARGVGEASVGTVAGLGKSVAENFLTWDGKNGNFEPDKKVEYGKSKKRVLDELDNLGMSNMSVPTYSKEGQVISANKGTTLDLKGDLTKKVDNKFTNMLPGNIRLNKAGKIAAGVIGLGFALSDAFDTDNAIRQGRPMGVVTSTPSYDEPATSTPSLSNPSNYSRYAESYGAGGDLVFALNANRRG